MLKGHLPRVIYHRVYSNIRRLLVGGVRGRGEFADRGDERVVRDWYFMAEQLAPAPHLAHPCAALHTVLVTVPRVSRSCEHFPDGFDLHLLRLVGGVRGRGEVANRGEESVVVLQ